MSQNPTETSALGGRRGPRWAEPTTDATVPDGDGREQHHGGHVVQERREDGRDEAEDDDHGPDSAPGQLVGLRGEHLYSISHMQPVNVGSVGGAAEGGCSHRQGGNGTSHSCTTKVQKRRVDTYDIKLRRR